MSHKDPADQGAPGRVSPYAPDIASTSVQAWSMALAEPGTKKALDEGLADVAAGRTVPWEDVRRRMRSK